MSAIAYSELRAREERNQTVRLAKASVEENESYIKYNRIKTIELKNFLLLIKTVEENSTYETEHAG
jgi:hypothetical protein